MKAQQDQFNVFKTVAEFSSDWLMWLGKDQSVIYVSPAVETITGYSPQAFVQNPALLNDLIHPQDRAQVLKSFAHEGNNPNPCAIEFRIIRKDGQERWIAHRCRPIFNEQGEIIGRISSNRDITDRKEAELALRQKERFLQALFDGMPDPTHVIDRDLKVVMTNKKLLQMKNVTQEEIRGKHCYEVYQGRNEPCEQCAAQEVFATGKPHSIIKTLPLPEGNLGYFEVLAYPLFEENGDVKQVIETTRDITEIKRAEEALRESETKLRSLFRAMNDLVMELDADGRYLFIAPTSPGILIKSVEEILGKTLHDIFPKEMADRFLAFIKKCLKENKKQSIEYSLDINDKTYWFEGTATPTSSRTVLFVARDITEHKRMEESLRKSEQKYKEISRLYRLMADNIPDLVWAKDLENKYLFVNKAICEKLLMAKNTEEPIGKDDLFFANRERQRHPERKDWHTFGELCANSDEVVKQTKKAQRFDEYGNVRGKFLYLDVYKAPLFDEQGKMIGTVGHGRIVTREKAMEKKLIESEHRYRRIFEESQDVIFVSTVEGKFLDINPAGLRLFGYASLEEIQNINIHSDLFVNPHEREEYLRKLRQQGFIKDQEIHLKKKDGRTLTVIENSTAIYDENNNVIGIRGILHDITDKKRLEEQLRQAQKMEAVGTLAGGIAHDFNNLLTIINGYSELLMKKMKADDPFYRPIVSIFKAGKRAAALTSQLLAFSRKQIYKAEIIQVNQVLSGLDKMLRRLIDEDIHIEIVLGENLPAIKADTSQIEQIFINLVVNARDALRVVKKPDLQKKITIETGQVILDKAYEATHPGSRAGYFVFFAVSDNGIGMDEETKQKIFEPFFTTKEKFKGTGLGLAMVYGIVKQNNGFIYVYSEPNEGTTFRIYWPVSDDKTKMEKLKMDPKDLRGNESVLIVEDEDDVRHFASEALESLGYRVFQAPNGQKALERIQQEQIKPDLIITDLIMPQLNGKDFVERAQKILPEVEVIYVSGYTDNHIVHNGMLEDGIHFLQKPYSVEELASAVRTVLDKKQH